MKATQTLVVCFSVLAFSGAVSAQSESKEQSSTQQSPSVTQPQSQQPQSQQQQSQQQQPQQQQGQDSQSQSASGGASGQSKPGQMSVSQLKNQKVTDAQGKELGQIQDIVVDLNSGRVHAVVLSFGGFLGMGDKNFAFPPNELKPGKGNQLMVNVDKQKLENAEGFAKGQWPGMDESYWGRVGGEGRAKASGGQQLPQEGAKLNLARASQLMGKQVQDKQGSQVGELKDMQVSLTEGRIQNLIVSVKDGGQATVPAKAISTTGTDQKLVISMDAKELQSQAKKQQGSASSGAGAQQSGGQSSQQKSQ